MTTFPARRLLFGTIALAASLVATATPANAATTVTRTTDRHINVTVTDCPKTGVGVLCRAFGISADYGKSKTGIETKSFEVTGYAATTLAGGEISTITAATSTTALAGTFTMAPNGRSAVLKFTVTLGCFAPFCGFDGPHTFKLTISRDAVESSITGSSMTETVDVGQCQAVQTASQLRHTSFKGTAKVTKGSTSTAIHVYQPDGKSNRLDSITETSRATSACDVI